MSRLLSLDQNDTLWLMDMLLGWLLFLPRDQTLFCLAALSTALLLGLRLLLINRIKMAAIREDLRRLRDLTSRARSQSDRDSLQRHRTNRGRVARQRLRVELPAVLTSVLLMTGLISWGAERLPWLPLKEGETFQLTLELPQSFSGKVVHLVPEAGLHGEEGWVRKLSLPPESLSARATWELRGDTGVTSLRIRLGEETLIHPVEVGTSRVGAVEVRGPAGGKTRIGLQPWLPLGWIRAWLGIPAWVWGYLIVTVPVYLISQRVLEIP